MTPAISTTDEADRTLEVVTLASALDELQQRGFTEHFQVVDGRLRIVGTPAPARPTNPIIREFHRFEGVSDPDDMAIVYAIEGEGGVRGTLADAFGAYADPAISAVLKGVPICRR